MTTRMLLGAAIALTASCTMTHHVDPCTEDPTRCADSGTSSDGGHDAGAVTDFGMPDLRGPDVFLSARIEPADATIRCDGTQPLRFFVTIVDRGEVELFPDWTTETPQLGTTDTNGVFTPRAGCVASGRTHVTATATDAVGNTVVGTATIGVRIELPATGDDPGSMFTDPAATGEAVSISYPLDGAVMPNNVLPPDIQWVGGHSGDVYRITVSNASIQMTAYTTHSGLGFAYDWTPPADLWRFVQENYDSGVDVQIDRHDAATSTVVSGTPVHIRLTRSSIAGTLYYWGITFPNGPGELDRIQAGTGQRDQILQGYTCIGCHAVSRDGHWLAGMPNGGSGSERGLEWDLTSDLTRPSPATRYAEHDDTFWFAASFNPDASRFVSASSDLRIYDAATGYRDSTITGLPAVSEAFYAPDWSPDGSLITMSHIDVATATWGHKYSHGDLAAVTVTGDAVGPVTLLHNATSLATQPEGGSVDSYSSISPDNAWVAFQHGNWARTTQGGRDTFADGYTSAALYLISRDGTNLLRLDRAVAGTHGSKDFWPTYAPFVSVEPDGHRFMWVAFTSGRRYGNAQVGTATLDPAAGRQLWVTALDMGTSEIASITSDPSNVPYWLPGQDPRLENLGARWAALACRAGGEGCGVSSECCSAYCAPGSSGGMTCQDPPVPTCHASGDACDPASPNCCRGLACIANTCVVDLHRSPMRFLRYLTLLSREGAPEPPKSTDDGGDGADRETSPADAEPARAEPEPPDPRREKTRDRR